MSRLFGQITIRHNVTEPSKIAHTFSISRVFEAHLELFVLGSVVFRAFHLGAAGSRIMPELRGTCNSYATCVHIVTRGRPAFSP